MGDQNRSSIPWVTVKLGDKCKLIMGQSPKSTTFNKNMKGMPFLQGKTEFGTKNPIPVTWCSKPIKIAKKGSVLISVRAPVGDVNIANQDVCIGRGLAAIDGSEQVENAYLFYRLIFCKPELEARGTGSIFKSINKDVLNNFYIPLPPLAEQKAIVHALNTVREAIDATERVIDATRELKKSMMKHLFTYGPVSFEDVDNVKLKETEIGQVPEHWEIYKIKDLVRPSNGLRRGPWGGSIKKEIFQPTGYAVYEQGNVIGCDLTNFRYFISDKKYKEMLGFEVSQGDILITAAGTIGKIIIVPPNAPAGIINQALIRIRLLEFLDPTFFCYLWNFVVNEGFLSRYSHGATLKNLSSITVLKNIRIPLPPLNEQKEISKLITHVDNKILLEDAQSRSLKVVFNGLLASLLNGNLRVGMFENNL